MPVQTQMGSFNPDLVVEVTMLCDLKCKGCYAPTLSPDSPGSVFLQPDVLAAALAELRRSGPLALVPVVAIRGGEPTLHPALDRILGLLHPLAAGLYLETNGNWIFAQDNPLLELCARLNVIVKISFDSMHSLSASDLRRICDILDRVGVQWMIAITEASEAEFEVARNRCLWIPDEKIFFQPKAFRLDSLIKPGLGVIHPDGQLSSDLSVKPAFLAKALDTPPNIRAPI